MFRIQILGALLCGILCAGNPTSARLNLHSFIGDHMMVQREKPVTVRGWADPGARVSLAIAGYSASVDSGTDGSWKALLDPLPVGGPYLMTVVSGADTISVHDILSGDIWVCSGQSNMEMPVGACENTIEEIASAFHPQIRLFKAANRVAIEPIDDIEGFWSRCRPSTISGITGTGYFFGRALHDSLDVPIGLVDVSWGGTLVEDWTSREALEADPSFRPLLNHWQPLLANPDTALVSYFGRMGDYHEDIYLMIHGGQSYQPYMEAPPPSPVPVRWVPPVPTWNFNAMIAPLTGFPIRGFAWYQGESNAGRAYQYRRLFPALIDDWRRQWGDEALPFCFVQLAGNGKPVDAPTNHPWSELREAQLMTLATPHTAMAVTIDIGDSTTVHPLNKQEVGRRLALGALHAAYQWNIPYSGPCFDTMRVDNGRAVLSFTHADDGLVASDGGTVRGFTVAGSDRRFVRADARIVGNTVDVWSDAVSKPVAIRYAWAVYPRANLHNGAGLPASPFRTDDWPGVTEGNEVP